MDMTATLAADRYALDRKLEEERLTLQARAFLDRISETMLREAGLEPGMRVLDLGSGMADTALLAAGIVGPAGRVTGVERDVGTLTAARERLSRLGTTNVELVEGDVTALEEVPGGPFDAVVGRLVLHYVPEPATALRSAAAVVRPGGLVVDIEYDLLGMVSHPPAPLFDWIAVLFCELFVRLGTHPRMGLELRPAFLEAGFREPVLRAENAIVGDPDDLIFAMVAETLRSTAPAMEATGMVTGAELDLETVEERLRAEIARTGGVVCGPTVVGAWARTPGP
jgi:SAM-dependent methyltransferase